MNLSFIILGNLSPSLCTVCTYKHYVKHYVKLNSNIFKKYAKYVIVIQDL